MRSWYALYTKPHKEWTVADLVATQGCEVYLPAIPASRKRPGRPAMRPFFPCYLFAQLDAAAGDVARVRWTPGLRTVVRFGGRHARVDDAVIADIRERLATWTDVNVAEARGFRRGEPVRIVRGPLRDVDALFDRSLNAEGRVRVLVALLGQWSTCDLDIDDVEPVRREV